MLKVIAAIVGLILLLSVDATTGNAATSTPQGAPSGTLGFQCFPDLGACTCRLGLGNDCENLLDAGMCQASEDVGYAWDPELKGQGLPWYYFVDCDVDGGNCTCTMPESATRGDTRRRPEIFDPASDNATEGTGEGYEMLDPPRRDAQTRTGSPATVNTPRSDDIVAPNNGATDRQNETVSARRGPAPSSDTAPNDASEGEVETAPTERRVRDHR